MKSRIYVETSVISYLTARPSRDFLVLARQQMTREFWEQRDALYDAWSSPLVIDEISQGDAQAAAARLQVCANLAMLQINEAAQAFAEELIAKSAVPATEPEDALHIAMATIQQMDYIASWNFAHMVGPAAKFKLQTKISQLGHKPPLIATPEEIYEELML